MQKSEKINSTKVNPVNNGEKELYGEGEILPIFEA